MPPGAKLHSIFHVSLLKKKIGPHEDITSLLPGRDTNDQCLLEPAAVLKRQVIMRNNQPVIQYLIRWQQLGEEESSWEDQ